MSFLLSGLQLIVYNHVKLPSDLEMALVGVGCWLVMVGCWIGVLMKLLDKTSFTKIFFMIDSILIAELAASFVFVSLLFVAQMIYHPPGIVFAILSPINIHLMSSAYRAIILYAHLTKPKIIIIKLSLLSLNTFFLGYGCYFLVADYSFTAGLSP